MIANIGVSRFKNVIDDVRRENNFKIIAVKCDNNKMR